jgi:site-specific DNA recombinase
VCANTQIRTDLVEIAVWQEVCQLLNDPQRLEREYHRRGHARPRGAKWETPESLRVQISKIQRGMARLIDGYAEGLIEKVEFEPRIKRMKQRVTVLEEQVQQLADEAVQQRTQTADWAIRGVCDEGSESHHGLGDEARDYSGVGPTREIDKQEVTVVFQLPDPSDNARSKVRTLLAA